MSTASTSSIGAVAKASSDGHRWYQLYWCVSHPPDHTPSARASRPRTNEVTLAILRRGKAAGFTVLVVTLDTFLLGWPCDLDTAYHSERAHVSRHVRPGLHATDGRRRLSAQLWMYSTSGLRRAMSGPVLRLLLALRGCTFLRENRNGPIVHKGVQVV